MSEVNIIGIDLAKRVFQFHGSGPNGAVVFRKKLSRSQVLPFLEQQPRCIVAMEACATAHGWARAIEALGFTVRLIPPAYVKPFVKRQKNDMADAEAIAEAASRLTMRFVAVKTKDQQARAMLFRTRDMLVGQRRQLINALRGHLAEFGIIAPVGAVNVKRLFDILEDETIPLPASVRTLGQMYRDDIERLTERLTLLMKQMQKEVRDAELPCLLQTMPGVGPVTAVAIETFAPALENFKCGRDFAAWLGLVPRQHSTGGKARLGRTSKMGQRDIRRLLIIGAMSVIRWAQRKGAPEGSWLARMMGRKPRMVIAVALANKMARGLWAMAVRQETDRKRSEVDKAGR